MNTRHTRGKWVVDWNEHGLPIVESSFGNIAHIRMHESASAAEVDANASLIAAAPDLLAFVSGEFCVCSCARCYGAACPSSYVCPKSAAIAKALGAE